MGKNTHSLTAYKVADVTFVPLRFSSNKISQTGIRVVTPNGYRIELDHGFDFSKLRQLITAVRGM